MPTSKRMMYGKQCKPELYITTSSSADAEKTFVVSYGITASRYTRGDYYDHSLTTFEVSQASLTQDDGYNTSVSPIRCVCHQQA